MLDEAGEPARPWLTVVLDDCSRAVAGYIVFLGAPSALNLSLALRQAIWRKTDRGWPVHGLPDVLYADHGSDFTSDHLAQSPPTCASSSSTPRSPGRRAAASSSGSCAPSPPSCSPICLGTWCAGSRRAHRRLTLPQLDTTIRQWITGTYHQREHSETGQRPQQAWLADGWLPRTPDSLE